MFIDDSGEDIRLFPGLSAKQTSYLTVILAQVYANPAGSRIIDRLEALPVPIYLREADLGSDQLNSGEMRGGLASGLFMVTVDLVAAAQHEAGGGDTAAQNMGEEFMHIERSIDEGASYDPEEHSFIDLFKARIGANSPSEDTRATAAAILNTSPSASINSSFAYGNPGKYQNLSMGTSILGTGTTLQVYGHTSPTQKQAVYVDGSYLGP